jgi:hypothetical protein
MLCERVTLARNSGHKKDKLEKDLLEREREVKEFTGKLAL